MLNVQNLKSGMMKTVLFMFFMLSSTLAFAQNRVTGVVVDKQGEPLIGVTVKEVGTQNAAVSVARAFSSPTSATRRRLFASMPDR